MKKRFLVFALCTVVVLTAVLSGCSSSGTSSKNQKITLQLSWLPQSEFMGFYVAKAKGYYKDAGIDVSILPGGSNIVPEQLVSNGVADFGVDFTSTLMTYQSKGWKLSEISQLFQKNGLLFVSKKSENINSLADLKGKKIGTWFGGYEYDLYALLNKAGLNKDKDVTLVQQDETMNQFIPVLVPPPPANRSTIKPFKVIRPFCQSKMQLPGLGFLQGDGRRCRDSDGWRLHRAHA